MNNTLNIALVAHDARKKELIEWVSYNAPILSKHNLYATGSTAKLLSNVKYEVREHYIDGFVDTSKELEIRQLLSGPLGGDQQIGAMIAEGKIDMLIFFCDNLITQGHQQDVGALVRLASLYNIAFATNRTTADMIMTSKLLGDPTYEIIVPSAVDAYKNRQIS
jgi:methylglyoxal synthase